MMNVVAQSVHIILALLDTSAAENFESAARLSVQSALDQTVSVRVLLAYTAPHVALARQFAEMNTTATTRVTLIEQPEPGLDRARDAAMRVAPSEFVVFLNVGDSLQTEAVAEWLKAAELRPDAAVIFSGWTEPRPGGAFGPNLPHTWVGETLDGPILPILLRAPEAIPPTALIRSERLAARGGCYQPTVSDAGCNWEEMAVYYRLLLHGERFGYVPRALLTLSEAWESQLWKPVQEVQAQRVALLKEAYALNMGWMIEQADLINQRRMHQIRSLNDTLRQRDAEIVGANRELDALRNQNGSLEARIAQLRADAEQQANLVADLRLEVAVKTEAAEKMAAASGGGRMQQLNALFGHIQMLETELAARRAGQNDHKAPDQPSPR